MQVEIQRASELPLEWLDDWLRIVEGSERWRSPFWRPELIAAMSRVNATVSVARLFDSQGRPFGYLPFQGRLGVGEPAGGIASDLHGLISERGVSQQDVLQLINRCGLKTFHFHHMPSDQTGFDHSTYFRDTSFWVDLRQGWLRYQKDLKDRGSKLIKRVRQRRSGLEREYGQISLIETTNPNDLMQLNHWKREACREKGWHNLYETSSTRALFADLLSRKTDELRGRLLILHAGSTPVAGLYLLQSLGAWHAWNVAYSPAASRWSPGVVAFLELMRNAETWGLQTLDLSRGVERFKSELSNRVSEVWEGQCGGWRVSIGLRRAWLEGKRAIGDSRLGHQARKAVRVVRRFRNRLLSRSGEPS